MVLFFILMETPCLFLHENDGDDKTQQEESYKSKAYAYLGVTTDVTFCACQGDCYNIWLASVFKSALVYGEIGLFVVGDDIANND